MQPTFQQGERVIVSPYLVGGPGRGDVIVFQPQVPSTSDYIKRVVGLPGDHITISGGAVLVNGNVVNEPYVQGAPTFCSGPWCDLTLGPNQYFVLGDNRLASSDSRSFGPVSMDHIHGKAWLRYFPFTDVQPFW
jgi:signal peptidase I